MPFDAVAQEKNWPLRVWMNSTKSPAAAPIADFLGIVIFLYKAHSKKNAYGKG